MSETETSTSQGDEQTDQSRAASPVLKVDSDKSSSSPSNRKRSHHNDVAPTEPFVLCTDKPAEDISTQAVKRPCLEGDWSSGEHRPSHWVTLSLITAGSQGAELGRDQTPIVQLSAVLGSFYTNSIMDRFTVNIRPERYASSPNDTVDSNQTTKAAASKQGTDAGLHTDPPDSDGTGTLVRLTEDAVKSAKLEGLSMQDCVAWPGLLSAMEMFTCWLQEHNVPTSDATDLGLSELITVTDGPLALRSVLHPEAVNRGLPLAQLNRPPWGAYVDLHDWCRSLTENRPADSNQHSEQRQHQRIGAELFQLAAEIGLCLDENLSKVDEMAKIVEALLKMNCPIPKLNIVRTGYEHKVLPRSLEIADSQVVEIRQVPWSATPLVIASFFSGLNVLPGGVAIRLTDGRRSNTAIVAFETDQLAKLALARHQHQLISPAGLEDLHQNGGQQQRTASVPRREPAQYSHQLQHQQVNSQQRPEPDQAYTQKSIFLQVYATSGQEFVQCAGCDQPNVAEFLSQLANGEQVVVRIRGLPYATSKQQILDFFAAVHANVLFSDQGVFLVSYPDKRPTGDAFVLFANDATVSKALKRHKDYLGDRYVEVFKSSPSEMVQVCKNVGHQKANSTTSSKPPTSLLDLQTRPVTSVTYPQLFGADPLSVLSMLSQNLQSAQPAPVGGQTVCPSSSSLLSSQPFLPFNNSALDTLSSLGHLSMSVIPQLGLVKSLPMSLATGSSEMPHLSGLAGGSATAFSGQTCMARDPMDPTDPECAFARPLPPDGGANALVQLCGLPLETSRHDIRRYLGPANLAKVYRMCRMDNAINQTTSSWLISLLNIPEATHMVRDLINRSFILENLPGQPRVYTNIPTFAVFHVGPEKKLSTVPLDDPKIGIPVNRIHGYDSSAGQPAKANSQHQKNGAASSFPGGLVALPTGSEAVGYQTALNRAADQSSAEELNYSKLIQGLLRQQGHQLPSQQQPIGSSLELHRSTPVSTLAGYPTVGLHPVLGSNPVSQQAVSQLVVPSFSSVLGLPAPQPAQMPGVLGNSGLTDVGALGLLGSTVVISGAPADATSDELTSLFQPILHLMTTRPQFTLYQQHQNGTADFLAFLNGPVEAQATCLLCPQGSLRGNKFVTLISSLPSAQAMPLAPRPVAMPSQALDQSIGRLSNPAMAQVNGSSNGVTNAGLLGAMATGFPVGYPFWSHP